MALEERKNQTHKIESNKKSFQFFFLIWDRLNY